MLLAVEGNIGAGKNTLLKQIASSITNTYVYPERIEEWTCVNGRKNDYNLLWLGVAEANKYAFPLQITTLESHRKTLKEINGKSGYHFCERSQYSCQHVFTRYCIENNNMNDVEVVVYDNIVSTIRKPDHILYLDTPPDICLERIIRRDREEEVGLSIDYLNILHTYHCEWLSTEQIPMSIIHYRNNI